MNTLASKNKGNFDSCLERESCDKVSLNMSEAGEAPLKILTTLPAVVLEDLLKDVPNIEITTLPEGGAPLPEGIEGELLVIPPWDPGNLTEILGRGVKWIHTVGTGVDKMPMDIVGDTLLTCARGASSIPIAEWVIATMLAFEKQFPESWLDGPPEQWGQADLGTLRGKTLGLIGFGGIGKLTAHYAQVFGMKVIAYRRSNAASGVEGVEVVADINAVMANSDHIVLALPLTPDSRHCINRQTLAGIPDNAGIHICNPSRGGLVDQEALREAIDDGRIARASLDTVDPEPLPEGHWIYSHPRVKHTTHISWASPEAFGLLMETLRHNIIRYQNGESLEGVVDKDNVY